MKHFFSQVLYFIFIISSFYSHMKVSLNDKKYLFGRKLIHSTQIVSAIATFHEKH